MAAAFFSIPCLRTKRLFQASLLLRFPSGSGTLKSRGTDVNCSCLLVLGQSTVLSVLVIRMPLVLGKSVIVMYRWKTMYRHDTACAPRSCQINLESILSEMLSTWSDCSVRPPACRAQGCSQCGSWGALASRVPLRHRPEGRVC